MISFVVRDGRHFMVHLKIKRTGLLLPTPQSVHYSCSNVPGKVGNCNENKAMTKENGKDKGAPQIRHGKC